MPEDTRATGARVMEAFTLFIEKTSDLSIEPANLEGVRVNTTGHYGTGWMLLRMSLHEPLLVLNLESDQAGSIQLLRETIKDFFYNQVDLDSSRL